MKTATKRIITFLISILTALTVCLPVCAAASRIDGYEGGSLYDNFSLGQSQDPGHLLVRPGDEIRIPLTADMFTFSDGKVPVHMEAVTNSQLSRVKVRARHRSGSEVLDYVQFDKDSFAGKPFIQPGKLTRTGTTAYISVQFAKEFISVAAKDFSFLICLSINGEWYEELSIRLEGTMQVDVVNVDKGTDAVNFSDGLVGNATGWVKNICVDLGAGVSVRTNMAKNRRYCGQAKILDGIDAYLSDRDLEALKVEGINLPELYPEIVMIFKLQTIGLKNSFSKVEIEKDGKFFADRTYHVYGDDLRYLGTIGDTFPYSDYYFITYERFPQLDALPINQKDSEKLPASVDK